MAGKTTARRPLTRERILRAALALADEDGIDAVAMRELGRRLGFEAMSLYNHVANKDDVLDGMLDLVVAEMEPPSGDGEWDAAIRASAVSVYGALRRHPWASGLLMEASRVNSTRLAYMDALLGRLRDAGFSPETTYHAYHVLDAHIFGFSLWQAGHTVKAADLPKLAQDFLATHPLDGYPHLLEHFHQHLDGGLDGVSAFEFSLDLLLDGLRRIHAGETRAQRQRSRSPRSTTSARSAGRSRST
jgi:AcrR family transcriptional regulator